MSGGESRRGPDAALSARRQPLFFHKSAGGLRLLGHVLDFVLVDKEVRRLFAGKSNEIRVEIFEDARELLVRPQTHDDRGSFFDKALQISGLLEGLIGRAGATRLVSGPPGLALPAITRRSPLSRGLVQGCGSLGDFPSSAASGAASGRGFGRILTRAFDVRFSGGADT